jgi:hypothetical protein
MIRCVKCGCSRVDWIPKGVAVAELSGVSSEVPQQQYCDAE